MSTPIRFLEDFLAKLPVSRGEHSVIVVSKEPQALRHLNWPKNTLWLGEINTADSVAMSVRGDLGVIVNQLEHMSVDLAVALLARLRDCHCDQLLVHNSGEDLTAQEMLALGFTRVSSSGSEGWFHYQREEFYEERSWNSPEQWAHPQNYKRFRW